jgi:hypothetical protein
VHVRAGRALAGDDDADVLVPEAGEVPDGHGGAERVIGDDRLHRRVVRTVAGGPLDEDRREPGLVEPLRRGGGRRDVAARGDHERVGAQPLDQPSQLRSLVRGIVGGPAQDHGHVQLGRGLLGALHDAGPVVVQRRDEDAEPHPRGEKAARW